MNHFACLFPGQGSQSVGMGKDLYGYSPTARDYFERADEALGYSISRLCFEGPEDELRLTRNTQPALLTVSVISYVLLQREPALAAGHSLGEYSAHVAAGTLEFEDAVKLVHLRGIYMQAAVPVGVGAMAAVLGADESAIREALDDTEGAVVEVANWNSPDQVVIAGHKEAVENAVRRIKPPKFVMLPVSAPFHTRLMKPAEDKLAAKLDGVSFRNPKFPVIANVDARPVLTGEEARTGLKRQVSRPVLWTASMEILRNEGIGLCVETGPGKVLSGLMKRMSRGWPKPPVLANVENRESLEKARQAVSDIL
jgi:[acyl-carrier-protein] S-malonyltransferase